MAKLEVSVGTIGKWKGPFVSEKRIVTVQRVCCYCMIQKKCCSLERSA